MARKLTRAELKLSLDRRGQPERACAATYGCAAGSGTGGNFALLTLAENA
ncbi:MAG TPA: hypothetical protein VI320_10710 [Terracidiphilus sp.]